MKFLIVFVALFALVLAAPVDEHHEILSLENEIGSKGYKYAFETSNGIHKDEEGHLEDKGYGDRHDGHKHEDEGIIVVHGSYSWVDEKTGAKFNIQYSADENGYNPAPIKLPQH